MIRSRTAVFALAATAAFLGPFVSRARAHPAAETTEAELRRTTQEMLDAIAPGQVEVWQRYTHERLMHVDENGTVRNKQELLAELTPLPPGLVGRIAIDQFKAAVHGDVAVVAHEDQEHLDYHGQILRSRFRSSDTWLRTPEGWRLIAQQTAAVLRDPPAVTLTNEQLCAYNGSYSLTKDITATVRCAEGGLTAERTGRPAAKYVPEVLDVFFVAGQPRIRRIFLRDDKGKVTGFVDRREGEDVRWVKLP
jgi:hypothetical protein